MKKSEWVRFYLVSNFVLLVISPTHFKDMSFYASFTHPHLSSPPIHVKNTIETPNPTQDNLPSSSIFHPSKKKNENMKFYLITNTYQTHNVLT